MKMLVLKGLPASGKSTEAKRLVDSGQYVRVNRDTIREMFLCPRDDGQKAFDPKIEKLVTIVANESAKAVMRSGKKHIVLDECNLNPKYLKAWETLAKSYAYSFEVRGMGVDIDECIRRDGGRSPNVGKRVILNMAIRNGMLPDYEVLPKTVIRPPEGKKIIICDVDGTISDPSHRLHWVREDEKTDRCENGKRGSGKARKNWKQFFEDMCDDDLRLTTLSILNKYALEGHLIVMVTARPQEYLPDTVEWLNKHNVPYDFMIMRKDGDYRRDDIIKQEILDKWFNKDDIEVVIDDRPQVLRMWKKNGLNVIDVGIQKEF